jgi:Mn2+/Fe2+ NRAMP family transporter
VKDPTNGAHAPSERGVESDSLPIIGRIKGFFEHLGRGIITGASDDDPSGIATYSQVGAQFGFAKIWTILFSYPVWRESRKSVRRLVASRGWVSRQTSGP